MTATTCDICKKAKEKEMEFAWIRLANFSMHDICMKCMNKHCGTLLQKLKKKVGFSNKS